MQSAEASRAKPDQKRSKTEIQRGGPCTDSVKCASGVVWAILSLLRRGTRALWTSCTDPRVCHGDLGVTMTERQTVQMQFRVVGVLNGCTGLAGANVIAHVKQLGRLPVADVVTCTCLWVDLDTSALRAPRPRPWWWNVHFAILRFASHSATSSKTQVSCGRSHPSCA